MPQNIKTPAGQGEGSGRDVALHADIASVALSHLEIQIQRLQKRHGLSLAHAGVVVEQVFGALDAGRR